MPIRSVVHKKRLLHFDKSVKTVGRGETIHVGPIGSKLWTGPPNGQCFFTTQPSRHPQSIDDLAILVSRWVHPRWLCTASQYSDHCVVFKSVEHQRGKKPGA